MPACLPKRLRAGRNYLRTMGKPLYLLINLGQPKVEIRRIAA
jgi:hypothetical protein